RNRTLTLGLFLEVVRDLAARFIRVVDDDPRVAVCGLIDVLSNINRRAIGQLEGLGLSIVESDRDFFPSSIDTRDHAFGHFQTFVAKAVDFMRGLLTAVHRVVHHNRGALTQSLQRIDATALAAMHQQVFREVIYMLHSVDTRDNDGIGRSVNLLDRSFDRDGSSIRWWTLSGRRG